MWKATLSSFSHPCDEVIDLMVTSMNGVSVDVLSELILGDKIDMLSDMEIVLMVNPGITLDSVISVA